MEFDLLLELLELLGKGGQDGMFAANIAATHWEEYSIEEQAILVWISDFDSWRYFESLIINDEIYTYLNNGKANEFYKKYNYLREWRH